MSSCRSSRQSAVLATIVATFCVTSSIARAEVLEPPLELDPAFHRPASAEEKARGDALARKMIEGLGGAEAFQKLRHVSFTFVPKKEGKVLSRREHAWDPATGRARVRWQKDGKDITAWLALADKSGMVSVDGARVDEEKARKAYLDDAYAAWVNDVYWLLSPYKAFDPGVRRAAIGGRLRTSFDDGTGLTPGDVYLYDFDDEGRLAGWSFSLHLGRTGRYRFLEPKRFAGVTLFARKVSSEGFEIAFEDITASTTPAAEALTPPVAKSSAKGQGAAGTSEEE